jgi:hypothetical protein
MRRISFGLGLALAFGTAGAALAGPPAGPARQDGAVRASGIHHWSGDIYNYGAAGGYGAAAGPVAGGVGFEGGYAGPAAYASGPMPEAAIPVGGNSGGHMPNYAWPRYAPYPNFSAVGYPTAYPWQAWPNIGPFYPYPEVPLDWRAVTMRWDDGVWWLDFKKHYTRPFFTPYPFGIFGY